MFDKFIQGRRKKKHDDFEAIKVTLASPEQVLSWSHGEVTKAETINYRTLKAEVDGLMCEKIFGPTKNYECYCGKYRRVRYKGIICDKCGVEITHNKVRRERMGHIKLAVPVTHVWFAYSIPNKIASILDISQKKILAVIYYTRYMVTELDKQRRKEIRPIIAQELKEQKEKEKQELEQLVSKSESGIKKEINKIKKEIKNKAKAEFKIETLTHDQKKEVAKLHKEFAQREEIIENEYNELESLVKKIEIGEVLTEDEIIILRDRNFLFFKAEMGAGAIRDLLSQLDLNKTARTLRVNINLTRSVAKRAKYISRLRLIEGFAKNNLHAEWMVVDVLPVIPPDLRPIIQLPGGKFATSDLNDLYRRVINRNNRLKRLVSIGAPEVILRNEKRMLQESVDALLDNSHRPSKAIVNLRKMPYKALTDNLRGKKGRFRRNLLGKRVDYSGRAVIVGSSRLAFNQTGLPKSMVLEMFKPFVIHELIENEHAVNIRMAKQIIDEEEDVVWDILEKLIKDRPVLLNRAPTLHKQGIQAFFPVLVEGDAIRLHPLACAGFNADFDGDAMAVHIPLTKEAVKEAKDVVLAKHNIIKQSDGSVLSVPAKDMVIGLYLLTAMDESEVTPIMYSSGNRAISAYNIGKVELSEKISVVVKGDSVVTSVGRLILNEALPESFRFVNEQLEKSRLAGVIKEIVWKYSLDEVVCVLDMLKDLGFKYATERGYDIAAEDFDIDIGREELLKKGEEKELKLQEDYMMGLLTYDEKRQLSIDMWNSVASEMSDKIWENIEKGNPVSQQVKSGAGKFPTQAAQIIGMKGMLRDPMGNWVELPVKGNHVLGLSVFEYFVASRGGRKGAADTALRTAKSGYLTRKLVDVAQDLIVRTEDCGFKGHGHTIVRDDEMLVRRVSFHDLICGRWTAEEVVHPKTGKVIVKANKEIDIKIASKIVEAGVQSVNVRSMLTCQAPLGVCAKCYGYDIGKNELVKVGKAVGVIAAQSMGEPATQMVLRTFHSGGSGKTDITRGLPRLEELFEIRFPKKVAYIMPFDGEVEIEDVEGGTYKIVAEGKKIDRQIYYLNGAKKLFVKDGDKVKDGQEMFIANDEKVYQSPFTGKISIVGNILDVSGKVPAVEEFIIPDSYKILIDDGDEISAGTPLTDGNINPRDYFEIAGMLAVQEYLIDNIQHVYTEQGIALNDKHVECIVRQMGRMAKIVEPGDSDYLIGSFVNKYIAEVKNDLIEKSGKVSLFLEDQLLGITSASLKTESFLSAMSFQEQVRVLTEASILGRVDYLRGLKENVIIGRSIPVGESARIDDFTKLEELKI
ncbi:MAG: DNA-directed RNA polymerase subunit beta' [Patescibacteria group bacterium]|nr:DNA-directed RNA polymerase subunit beta' [Patescibacteria group bacterium]